MDDFIKVHNWFDEKYQAKSSGRYTTFKIALNLLSQKKNFKNIVETGTTRMADDWGAGSSTILFGDFLSHYGGHLWTVDIEPRNIEVCKQVTAEYSGVTDYVVSDSLKFLEAFPHKIDMLYLDSYDFPLDGTDPTPCQEHQLKEFKLAEGKLSGSSIVLLDDNDFPGGGKTRLTKIYLRDNGYLCLYDSQQSLWFR